jgi:hypothetical protein
MLKLLILLTVFVSLIEGLPLLRQKRRKELVTFTILIGITLLIGIGKTIGLPTPIEWLNRWLRPVGEAIFKRF